MREKICFVVQRYGEEVNGGAELQCREFAEHLADYYDMEVLTSRAVDYQSWENVYPNDTDALNGVTIRRFPVLHPRDPEVFGELNNRFLRGYLSEEEEQAFFEEQGPLCPDLIRYLRTHVTEYAVVFFFTYLYYPTVMGLREAADRAILVPEAHPEPYLKMRTIRREVFTRAKALFMNTEEEAQLVREQFHNYEIPYLLGGGAVELPEDVSAERFRTEHAHIGDAPFLLYVGRIDEGKNCREMFDFFQRYKKAHPSDLKLVLMGKPVIPVPETEDIVSLGFVSEQEKFDGLAACELLLLPSKLESLSIVVLEAFSLKRPVLVHGACEVLKGHCLKSDGGLYYENYEVFEEALGRLLQSDELRRAMGGNGYRYVQDNYRWETVTGKMRLLIDYVKGLRA